MKPSRLFVITVVLLFAVAGGVYYFFTSKSPFEKVNAESLSPLDAFLSKNYFFTLNLDKKTEEAIRIACVEKEETEEEMVHYPCQNENPGHKVVVGWVKNEVTYMSTVEALVNEQLFWKNHPLPIVLRGDVSCRERVDYPYYYHSIYGMDCVTLTEEQEKLYSSIIFLQPKELKNKKVFIAVLNTSKETSAQEVENEILLLLAKQRISSNAFRVKELFAVAPKLSDNVAGFASSTSERSTQMNKKSPTNSSNTITKNTGGDIDATVCDAVDVTKCYPIYCESITAVWNYSLNKCVEPAVSTASSTNVSSACPDSSPVWDGTKCRELIGDIVLDNRCSIRVGGDSCEMEVFWSSQSTKGAIEARLQVSPTEAILFGTEAKGKVKHRFMYQESPYTVELYDAVGKLNEGKFVTVCEYGKYDKTLKKCVDPLVEKAEISGEYYASPGAMKLTCSNATSYLVTNSDTSTVVASGTYSSPVSAPLFSSGNYSAVCVEGDHASVPVVRYYNAPPPPEPSLSLVISPRTLLKNQKAIINWNIQYPVESCKLTIIIVCKENEECKPEQVEFENATQEILLNGFTDDNDPATSRPIGEAVRLVAPKHIDKDWFAVGQKTLPFVSTADVILSCGDKQEKKRVYVRTGVQSTSEQ